MFQEGLILSKEVPLYSILSQRVAKLWSIMMSNFEGDCSQLKTVSTYNTERIFEIDFALSKCPYRHKAYLLGVRIIHRELYGNGP